MFQVNCYVLGSEETHEGIVIDPGDNASSIVKAMQAHNLNLKYILATHGHFDHVGGLKQLKELAGGEFLAHAEELEILRGMSQFASLMGIKAEECPLPDRYLEEGDEVQAGEIRLQVLHTPGHSPGGVCFSGDGIVFSGDTLFWGSIGRTDFPGCSFDHLAASVRAKLYPLDKDVKVYPGHGPATTIGFEKEHNPFVRP